MTSHKTTPLPPLLLNLIPQKPSVQTFSSATSSSFSSSSSLSSSQVPSQASSQAQPVPKSSVPDSRPKTLFHLLRNRQITPSISHTASDLTSESEAKLAEMDLQQLLSPSALDTAVPPTTSEPLLEPLNECSEPRSDGEFTHQSDLSNIYQVEREEVETPPSERSFESSSVPKPVSSATPSELISEPDSPKTPMSAQGSVKEFFLERAGQRKDSRMLRTRKRVSTTSSHFLPEYMFGSEMRESSIALPRSKSSKSIAHSQYKSEPMTDVENVEDLNKVKFEEYMEERGDHLSPPIRELFETYMDGPMDGIEELNLDETQLVDSDLRDLCQLIQAVRELEAINLASNNLQFHLFDHHIDLYSRNITKVKSLTLSHNPIGNDQITSLFLHFLISHVNLEEIYLENCFITDKDFERLASSLEYLRLLRVVDLRNNKITDKSVERVLKLLRRCGELHQFMLNGNRFSKKAGAELRKVEERVEFEVEIGCSCRLF